VHDKIIGRSSSSLIAAGLLRTDTSRIMGAAQGSEGEQQE
jgi:hypothetical protein